MYFDASTFHAAGDIAIDITSHYHLHVGTLVGWAAQIMDNTNRSPACCYILRVPKFFIQDSLLFTLYAPDSPTLVEWSRVFLRTKGQQKKLLSR